MKGTETYEKIMKELELRKEKICKQEQYIAELTGLAPKKDFYTVISGLGFSNFIKGIILPTGKEVDSKIWRQTKETIYFKEMGKSYPIHKLNKRTKVGKEVYQKLNEELIYDRSRIFKLFGFGITAGYEINFTDDCILVHFRGDAFNKDVCNIPEDAMELTASEYLALKNKK